MAKMIIPAESFCSFVTEVEMRVGVEVMAGASVTVVGTCVGEIVALESDGEGD
jgi:hypothetical protein